MGKRLLVLEYPFDVHAGRHEIRQPLDVDKDHVLLKNRHNQLAFNGEWHMAWRLTMLCQFLYA